MSFQLPMQTDAPASGLEAVVMHGCSDALEPGQFPRFLMWL
jgi:hypothetical protein